MKIKILLLGDGSVGKTALAKANKEPFSETYHPTIGLEVYEKEFTHENVTYPLQIWDSAGLEKFKAIFSPLFLNTQVIILTFDLTNRLTFLNLTAHMNIIARHAHPTAKVILVSTKSDLKSLRQVGKEEIEEFISIHNKSSSFKIKACIETSAKTGEGVDLVFESIVKLVNREDYIDNIVNSALKEAENTETEIIKQLRAYVTKIENLPKKNDQYDFSHGFWFFKESRAKNREANYLLAKNLIARLESSQESLHDIFRNVKEKRLDLASQEGLFSKHKNHGINSSALNNAIDYAKKNLGLKK